MFRRTRAEVLAQIEELRTTVAVLDCKIAHYEGNPAADWRSVIKQRAAEAQSHR